MRDFGLGSANWHTMSEQDLYEHLKTKDTGLTSDEAAKLLLEYGLNRITPPKVTHWFVKFLLSLVGGFQGMLWVGSVLCFVVYGISKGKDIQTQV